MRLCGLKIPSLPNSRTVRSPVLFVVWANLMVVLSYPSAYPRRVLKKLLPEQSRHRSFLRFDLEAIHIEDEGRKKEKGQDIRQIQGPADQNEQHAEIHRVARVTIDP